MLNGNACIQMDCRRASNAAIAHAAEHASRRCTACAFHTWRTFTLTQQPRRARQIDAANQALQRRCTRCKAVAWSAWVEHHSARIVARLQTSRAVTFWWRRRVGACLKAWRARVAGWQRRRAMSHRADSLYCRGIVRCALALWQPWAQQHALYRCAADPCSVWSTPSLCSALGAAIGSVKVWVSLCMDAMLCAAWTCQVPMATLLLRARLDSDGAQLLVHTRMH